MASFLDLKLSSKYNKLFLTFGLNTKRTVIYDNVGFLPGCIVGRFSDSEICLKCDKKIGQRAVIKAPDARNIISWCC